MGYNDTHDFLDMGIRVLTGGGKKAIKKWRKKKDKEDQWIRDTKNGVVRDQGYGRLYGRDSSSQSSLDSAAGSALTRPQFFSMRNNTAPAGSLGGFGAQGQQYNQSGLAQLGGPTIAGSRSTSQRLQVQRSGQLGGSDQLPPLPSGFSIPFQSGSASSQAPQQSSRSQRGSFPVRGRGSGQLQPLPYGSGQLRMGTGMTNSSNPNQTLGRKGSSAIPVLAQLSRHGSHEAQSDPRRGMRPNLQHSASAPMRSGPPHLPTAQYNIGDMQRTYIEGMVPPGEEDDSSEA
jgi:hypothetical protein